MTSGPPAGGHHRRRRWLPSWARYGALTLITVLVLEYLVLPQLLGAREAVRLLSQVTPQFLALGVALELCSLASYSMLTRCVLPPANRPSLWTVLRIDVTGLGVSHVLPGGGATASALRYRLLTLSGTAPTDVLSATAIEGAGTAVVLAMVFGAGLLLALPSALDNPYLLVAALVAGVCLVAAGVTSVLLTRRTEQMVHVVRSAAAVLPGVPPDGAQRLVESLAARLAALVGDRGLMAWTLTWASANWLLDAAALWVFLRAFGQTEGLQGMLVGYGLAGVLALLPLTPGGLGIVEGTLVSVLVGFGTPQANALLGVITWRLAEFWLPIPLAALSYLSLRTGTLRHHHLPARVPIVRGDRPSLASVRTEPDG